MMTDAIALLAISQLVCLAAIFYLHTQLQAIRNRARGKRVTISPRAHPMANPVDIGAQQAAAARAATEAYAPARTTHTPTTQHHVEKAALASRLADVDLDIPALARRMQKSEEEVRILLRRQGVAR